jgi:hypothetical protein
MEMIFQKLMAKKNDKELEDYLINIMTYNREIIEAAISEMKIRGRVFTDEELSTLETKIQERENTIGKNTIKVRDSWEKEIVEDKSAISLFSRKTIDWSTLIFGIIVGSILMISNLNKTEKKKGIIPLVIFAIIYLIIEINILLFIENLDSSMLNMIRIGLNALGALVIHTLFWNKFIGKEIKYRKKSIWFPIILGIIIEGLFFLLWFKSQN